MTALVSPTVYIQPHQKHGDAMPPPYPDPGNDYINAFTTYELAVTPSRSHPVGNLSGRPSSQQNASTLQDIVPSSDDFPIRVPVFSECPHKETLSNQVQVEEWIAARAMEFAFTKHGERKARKASIEESVQQGRRRCHLTGFAETDGNRSF